MEQGRYWDVGSLASALAGSAPVAEGTMSVSYLPGDGGTDGVIQAVLHDCGDLSVLVGVAGLEIQASVALEPVSEIQDAAAFEHRLLKANKLLPLSTFGITEIEGREYYEIFGQMSAASRLEEVVEEIETLGRNALDAVAMMQDWKRAAASAAA
jgi:hypothetical protein